MSGNSPRAQKLAPGAKLQ
ncbi:hypothetical protein A2U01_0110503, partial [Trifolium medium]|nr:hypothetical protein [Trifolium medium]